jgi:hypothetical protein
VSTRPGVGAGGPLELLHPSAVVRRLLVAGDRCPAALLPTVGDRGLEDVDLAVIAPSASQLATAGWLRGTLETAARALAPDGILYALVPPLARVAARRRLGTLGLELGTPLVQLPPRDPRYLVPLRERPWSHTLRHEIGAHAAVRRVLGASAALPGGPRLLAESLPGTALIARPPGAAPLAAWLERLDGDTPPTAYLATLISWRGRTGPVALFCFGAEEERPWGVAKVGADAHTEAEAVRRLGDHARAAGADVPRLLASGAAGGRPALVESALGGRTGAGVLIAAPERFADVSGRIASWLEGWNATTARRATLSAAELERRVFADLPREQLPPRYRDWLAGRCAALDGTPLPLVAAHHDLTMWNVRLGDDRRLGILDWAEAQAEALPMTDLFYALADAAAASDGYRDRLAGVRSCFEAGGARAATAAALVDRARALLDLTSHAAELCFHACWLRHAANERGTSTLDRSFGEIVRWLAGRSGAS